MLMLGMARMCCSIHGLPSTHSLYSVYRLFLFISVETKEVTLTTGRDWARFGRVGRCDRCYIARLDFSHAPSV